MRSKRRKMTSAVLRGVDMWEGRRRTLPQLLGWGE